MKKILFYLTVVLVLAMSSVFASDEVIQVKLNDAYIDFTDELGNKVEPTLINDRTMVPMRKIFETLGATIEWDGALNKVTAITEDKKIVLQINNEEATVEDLVTAEVETIILDSVPVILENRTMVPVRFIAESLEKQVGWDAENKVVVIIDYNEILEGLNETCSNFIAMQEEQTVEINTFDLDADISGKLKYKDLENSKSNEYLELTGNMEFKKSENMLKVKLKTKITGNGELNSAIKEGDYDSITVEVIADMENDTFYAKSNLFADLPSGKWIKGEIPVEAKEQFNLNLNKKIEVTDLMMIPEEELTKDSYEELLLKAEMISKLYGNDNIKVTGTTTKVYTISFDLEKLLSDYAIDESVNEFLEMADAEIKLKNTYKKGMNTKGSIDIAFEISSEETKEKVSLDLGIDAEFDSYNKDITISVPSESQIYVEG